MENKSFLNKPTKKTLWIFGLLWLFSTTCFVLVMTNLFEENPLQKRYSFFFLMIFFNTVTVLRLFKKYFQQKTPN